MHEPRPERTTSPTMITVLSMISVALIIFFGPAGVYAGTVLALLVLATVLASPVHRHDGRMLGVAALAVAGTLGFLLASLITRA